MPAPRVAAPSKRKTGVVDATAEMRALALLELDPHVGDWNYTVRPRAT